MSQQSDLYRDLFEPGWREREQAKHDNIMEALSGVPFAHYKAIAVEGGGCVVVKVPMATSPKEPT